MGDEPNGKTLAFLAADTIGQVALTEPPKAVAQAGGPVHASAAAS